MRGCTSRWSRQGHVWLRCGHFLGSRCSCGRHRGAHHGCCGWWRSCAGLRRTENATWKLSRSLSGGGRDVGGDDGGSGGRCCERWSGDGRGSGRCCHLPPHSSCIRRLCRSSRLGAVHGLREGRAAWGDVTMGGGRSTRLCIGAFHRRRRCTSRLLVLCMRARVGAIPRGVVLLGLSCHGRRVGSVVRHRQGHGHGKRHGYRERSGRWRSCSWCRRWWSRRCCCCRR